MLPDQGLNALDLNTLDIDVRVGRACQRHQEHFLEQLILGFLADIRAAENIQYVAEICNSHLFLTCILVPAEAPPAGRGRVYTPQRGGFIAVRRDSPEAAAGGCQRQYESERQSHSKGPKRNRDSHQGARNSCPPITAATRAC